MKKRFFPALLLITSAFWAAFSVAPRPVHPSENCVPLWQKNIPEPSAGTLTLSVAEQEVERNETACLTVTASGFAEILTIQYSMNWNPEVLKFKEFKSFGLPGMDTRNFGLHLLEKGIITFSWYDQKLMGISKDDGVSLYEMCFEAIGAAGSETRVEFTSKPTVVEISNAASAFLDLRTETGTIKIK